jgi:hypothetical protein
VLDALRSPVLRSGAAGAGSGVLPGGQELRPSLSLPESRPEPGRGLMNPAPNGSVANGNSSPTSAAAPIVFTVVKQAIPTADTHVAQNSATKNYGSSASLAACATPTIASYLKFAVPSADPGHPLAAATLTIKTTTAASDGSQRRPRHPAGRRLAEHGDRQHVERSNFVVGTGQFFGSIRARRHTFRFLN